MGQSAADATNFRESLPKIRSEPCVGMSSAIRALKIDAELACLQEALDNGLRFLPVLPGVVVPRHPNPAGSPRHLNTLAFGSV